MTKLSQKLVAIVFFAISVATNVCGSSEISSQETSENQKRANAIFSVKKLFENVAGASVKTTKKGRVEVSIPRGEYHFFAKNAEEKTLWISNHDPQKSLCVAFPIVGFRDGLTIDGNGSVFIFHGQCVPFLIQNCANLELKNLKIDFARPLFSEAIVRGFENGKTRVDIDASAFPYEIRDGKIFFVGGENFPEQTLLCAMAFCGKTGQIVAETSDILCGNEVEKNADGTLLLPRDLSSDGVGVSVGDTLVLRTWARPAPAIFIDRSEKISLRDVAIHASFGIGLLAQCSRDISFRGTRSATEKTAGVFPRSSTKRVHSTSADATHFSNCGGKIVVENAFFETMLDDAINVHSTCLAVAEIISPNTLRCVYRHHQATGFDIFSEGSALRFIKGKTLEPLDENLARVRAVRRISPTEIFVELDAPVPAEIVVGDAVENADLQPEVVFRGNVVQHNRARGALFTTPKKVLVENNIFRNVAGSAILFAGDAQGWFESGSCDGVEIRKNIFENNLTSRFQFTNAIISIYPEVRELVAQKRFYHRDILIEENVFRTFDVPLLFAISAEKIRFKNNRIYLNENFRAWHRGPFEFLHCSDIKICGNELFLADEKMPLDSRWQSLDSASSQE